MLSIEDLPEAAIVIDERGTVHQANALAARCLAVDADRLAGSVLADLMPDEVVALDTAVRAGDLPAARALHERLEPLAEAIYGAPPGGRATARLKWCLREMGIIPDATVRLPQPPVDAADAAALRAALKASGM